MGILKKAVVWPILAGDHFLGILHLRLFLGGTVYRNPGTSNQFKGGVRLRICRVLVLLIRCESRGMG
jgi:hypothetical protein